MKDNGFPLFIGFDTLEEWLASIDRSRLVFANFVTELGKTSHRDVRIDRMVIVVSQPVADLVYYCRLPVGELQFLGGKPFNPDHEQQVKQAKQAWKIVESWLRKQGLKVHKAVIAAPQNLVFLEGRADFLVFDNETQSFQRKP